MSDVDEYWDKEQVIDAFVVVHNHLYLMEQSIRREIERKTGYVFGPEIVDLSQPEREINQKMQPEIKPGSAFQWEIKQQIQHQIEPGPCPVTPFEIEIDQQMEHEFEAEHVAQREIDNREVEPEREMECAIGPEPWDVAERMICYDFRRQRSILRLVCRRILYCARRAAKAGYMDEDTRTEIAARAVVRLHRIKNRARLASETEDVEEQRPLKIHHTDVPNHLISKDFHEMVKAMDAVKLDKLHTDRVKELMFNDPRRKVRIPSRFCSFHLAGFNLDEKSTALPGPPYQPGPGTNLTKYVDAKTNAQHKLASSSFDVISIRVVRVGPDYTYPVEVYGKVIARDEVDYKCVYLFERERMNAQTINSEKDMLALTGPYRALVTLGYIYFEFDLKIKGKGDPADDVPLSKGVLPHYFNPNHNRIKLQLPSYKSIVKLVLQHVRLPVAASLEISVVNHKPNGPLVHFDGKITAGTSRNYRHHMLLYDSSVCRGCLVSETVSLPLNRNLVAVNGYVEDPDLVEDEKLVLYVCFLDASCEIEDKDKMDYEDDDGDDDDVYDDDDEEEADEEKEEEADEEKEEEEADEEKEEDPKNIVILKYPETETVGEHGGHKLKVKVNWTAVLDKPKGTDFFYRYCRLPGGLEPNYRNGGFFN
ncbi:unnamed protein product [Alopecurus aequalis]